MLIAYQLPIEDLIAAEQRAEEPPDTDAAPAAKRTPSTRTGLARGPKTDIEWRREIKRLWAHADDIDALAASWVATVPRVRTLAARYGGGLSGRGRAVKEFLLEALAAARQSASNEKVRTLLEEYPTRTLKDIASGFGMTREHFSRKYGHAAAEAVVVEFRRAIGRNGKA